MEPLTVNLVDFYGKSNAKENRTEEFDLLENPEVKSPIFRRGCNFYFAVRFDREFDAEQDVVRVGFGFGKFLLI